MLLLAVPLYAQSDSTGPQPQPAATMPQQADQDILAGDRMTPPMVGIQTGTVTLGSEERSNYLRGSLVFTGAYSDNVLGSDVNGHPEGDASWSLGPRIELDKTTPRTAIALTYAPGFTFYNRISSRNEQDQNVSFASQFRLSEHVTLRAEDVFQKSSNVFNQPDLGGVVPVIPGTSGSNDSVIAPVANRIGNLATTGLDYQFSRNQMVGVSAGFSLLNYPDSSQVPGLYNSSSQEGSVYYALRTGRSNYLGVSYQYERLIADPGIGQDETQAHAFFAFYSKSFTPRVSVSVFGGPQYQSTSLLGFAPTKSWQPYAGANLSWHSLRTAVGLNYLHQVASSGGLGTAVHLDTANVSVEQMLRRRLTATATGGWSQNNLIVPGVGGSANGHTLYASFAVRQQLGTHVSAMAGYAWLGQNYAIATFAGQPTTNREFISLSYEFERALGR